MTTQPAIEIRAAGPGYEAYLNQAKVGGLELFEDGDGRQWINHIEVNENYRRKGIGTRLIQHALEDHQAIYASTATKQEHESYSLEEDTRHLTDDGAAFVQGCIDKGILHEDWWTDPFERSAPPPDQEEAQTPEEESPPVNFKDLDENFPALPTNFTTITASYVEFTAVDGTSYALEEITIEAKGQEPLSYTIPGGVSFQKVEHIQRDLALHYHTSADKINLQLTTEQ